MAANRRPYCQQCKKRFHRDVGSRRVYCMDCRPPRKAAVGEVASEPSSHLPGEVESTVRQVLEEAGRLTSVPGVLAVRLAKHLDGSSSAASTSALAKQIDELVGKALDGIAPPADFVDDMAERRRSRSSA